MANRPLDIGSRGKTNLKELAPGKWKASCRFRDLDGRTRPVERTGPTSRRAEAALEKALRERVAPPPPKPAATAASTPAAPADSDIARLCGLPEVPTTLTTSSRVKHAAAIWLDRTRRKRVGTTYDTHRRWCTARVLPEFGELLITEMTVPRLEGYFDRLAEEPSATTGRPLSANSRRGIRKVVSGILQTAVRYGVLTINPVDQMDEIEEAHGTQKKRPRAYDAETTGRFFAAIDTDPFATRSSLNVLIKMLFFTGCRIGEVLALRWQEINLTDQPVRVSDPASGEQTIPPCAAWINGNIVPIAGRGLVRHDGKTADSIGVVGLSPSMVSLLALIRPPNARPLDPVFPSGNGRWRDPNNTQTAIRRLRKRIGPEFSDFTSHFGRRTKATALDGAGMTARQIADELRKASVTDVQHSYMGRGLANPAAAGLIEDFYRPTAR